MKITLSQLHKAAAKDIISSSQAEALYEFLSAQPHPQPSLTPTHALYYFGGLIAIGAMTLFMNLGWEQFGGAGIFFIALLYAALGLIFTHRFAAKSLPIPAGICATFVVCLIPLAVYGLQQWWGFWPERSLYRDYHLYVRWNWLYMELATLAVGIAMAWKYKYPFLLMPIAVTLWYLSMDLSAFLSGSNLTWELRMLVSTYFGALMIVLAVWVDIRSWRQPDYAYWLYLFGVVAFWGGLSSQHSESELSKFIYFCINLLMIGFGVLLLRRVFVLFGALGCCFYLGYLAAEVFQDSWLFPIALVAIGLALIYFGAWWQKHERLITQRMRARLPHSLQALLASKEAL